MSTIRAAFHDVQGTAGSTNNTIRFNDGTGRYEVYTNGFWIQLGGSYTAISGKNKVVFTYTGAGQSWTVPAGVTSIYAKIWGGGGGGGSHSGWSYGAAGGGGGHTRGTITVTPGSTLGIVVGGGGVAVDGVSAYGGGGARSTSGSYGAGGGGYSAIFLSTITNGNELMVAGGGGGGGAARAGIGNTGGAGGGIQGQDGVAPYDGYYVYRGRGGTQTAGGVGGGYSGTKFAGGQASAYGGGGGGGYYGGSGGSYIEDDTMGGGGGGSGWYNTAVVKFGETLTGSGYVPAGFDDPDLQGIAPMNSCQTAHGQQNAGNNQGGTGGSGAVIIYY